jgi:hypothetical protein
MALRARARSCILLPCILPRGFTPMKLGAAVPRIEATQ